ncbi:unnamed protein product [Notodromas monacha]|uniref:Uncharacterized protein n=1 Tax=Notodromas monacha TaxID=399045 RepID=A0A7R9BV91_9CRUS|nr:unnamed protein product [Notodromas monacha]CAG0920862.1 unnamed protein product [Notodromas monacha]
MVDIMKMLVYLLCMCSCFEGFAGLKSFRKPLSNDRVYGWIGFGVKAAETVIGFLSDGLKLLSSSTDAATQAMNESNNNVRDTEDHATSEGLTSVSSDQQHSLSSKLTSTQSFRMMEFMALSSMALFFTGEYNLRLVSKFLKTLTLASVLGMGMFYNAYPPAVEFMSNIFFPLTMTALMTVSNLSDNGHLFWAVFNTVFFDKFSEATSAVSSGASYNSAVTLNFFVNALREVLMGVDSELSTPVTDTFKDIYVFPINEFLVENDDVFFKPSNLSSIAM